MFIQLLCIKYNFILQFSLWCHLFRRIDDDKGKTYELCQSTVKCMRGILACWISQAEKVSCM